MDAAERKEWIQEELGLDGKKVKTFDTPLESGAVVIEDKEKNEDRRAEELEGRRGPLHPLVNST